MTTFILELAGVISFLAALYMALVVVAAFMGAI